MQKLDLNFLKLTKYNSPILKTKSVKVVNFNEELVRLAETMVGVLHFYEAAGVSAVQLGCIQQFDIASICGTHPEDFNVPAVFVMVNEEQKPEIVVNPEVITYDDELELIKEGCLSFPNLFFPVKRSKSIKAKYLSLNGSVVERDISAFTARIYLHEFDHLQGMTYFDRISATNRDIQLKEISKLKKKGFWDEDDNLLGNFIAQVGTETKNEGTKDGGLQ